MLPRPSQISHTRARSTINKQCSFGVSHSPFSQVTSERARTSVSSPRGALFTVSSSQDYLLTLFICEPRGRGIWICIVEFVKCCLNTKQLYENYAKWDLRSDCWINFSFQHMTPPILWGTDFPEVLNKYSGLTLCCTRADNSKEEHYTLTHTQRYITKARPHITVPDEIKISPAHLDLDEIFCVTTHFYCITL